MYNLIIFLTLLCFTWPSDASNRWPNHDISTLKLLQIVHRHGERAPIIFTFNDPFKDEKYWPQGIGQLTLKGKYHMYKLGQFIRKEYNTYFGDQYSPREVYARSSLTNRCVESLSCLLSGAYPPKQKTWQWNEGSDASLGQLWQPFPIQTFMPKNEDLVLEQETFCPSASRELTKILQRPYIVNYFKDNKDLMKYLRAITGSKISDTVGAGALYDALSIELSYNYTWPQWTVEEQQNVIKRLQPVDDWLIRNYWDSPVIRRLRAGGLVRELNNNWQKVLDKHNDKKMYVYSTHDIMLSALMAALNITNLMPTPFGASIFFELHQDPKKVNDNDHYYFVRVFYHNETVANTGTPHSLSWGDCQGVTDCPVERYLESTKYLLYDDFNKECNQL